MDFLAPIFLSLRLAFFTTLLLLVLGIPLSFWLSQSKSKTRFFVDALVSLPLVLPPTVLGFYFLVAFNSEGIIGSWFPVSLVFSFSGILLASIIYSLPFMIQPLKSGFQSLPSSFTEVGKVLGKSNFEMLWKVFLPNIKPAIFSAVLLTFAHTIGEFGVVLMIGGNIPNETQVASIAIYDQLESLNYGNAHLYSGMLLCFSFLVLLLSNRLGHKFLPFRNH